MQNSASDQSITRLRQVLLGAGLERYFEVLAQNDIDAELLGDLTDEEFVALGIQSIGHRIRLRKIARERAVGLDDQPATDAVDLPEVPQTVFKRQVVVMFVDLAGFTALSQRYSGEDMVRLMSFFFRRVDDVIESYDGRVNKHMGDCSIAVFGLEGASGHEVENAVAVAEEIHRRFADPIPGFSIVLQCHIGVASGQVVIQRAGAVEDYAITGNSMNLASRLADLAEAGKTLISDRIYRQVSGRIECSRSFSASVKGLAAPIMVYEYLGQKEKQNAQLFFGRNAELVQFAALMGQCKVGQGATVTIKGEAGIGKSSLVQQLKRMAREDGVAPVTALVLDFGGSRSSHPVATLVCGLLSVIAGIESTPQDLIEGLFADGRIDARERMFFYLCTGQDCPADLAAAEEALDARARKHGIAEAARAILALATEAAPVVAIIEDMHWSDRLLRDFVACLAQDAFGTRLLLVLTSRPSEFTIDDELRDERGLDVETMNLTALDPTATFSLVERLAKDVPPELVALCLERAKGHPLFLKQLLAHLGDADIVNVPDSIQSIVQSRMDQLAAPDRRLIEAAAILGQHFTFDAVQWVSGRTEIQLSQLVRAGLILRSPTGFMFTHALIRDSVLDLMLLDHKAALHLRAAEWMRGNDAELHAEHLELAGDPGAPAAYLEAARRLHESAQPEPALALVDRALALAAPADIAWELALLRAELLLDKGQSEEAIRAYRDVSLTAPGPESQCRAMIGQIAAMRVVDRIDEAHLLLDQAEDIATRTALPRILSEIHYYRGALYFPAGRTEDCLDAHSRAVREAEVAGSPLLKAKALSGLGDAHYARGKMRTAHRAISECLALADAHGLARIEAANRFMLATVRIYLNETDQALRDALASIELSVTTGAYRPEIVSRLTAGWILIAQNACPEARDQIERGLERARDVGATRFDPFLSESLARVQLLEGDRQAALATIRRAAESMRDGSERFIGPWVLGTLARITDDDEERSVALSEGEALLRAGCVGHNYYRFYHAGIETGIALQDVGLLDRYADALAAYTADEPVPWSDYHIDRAHLFAAILEQRQAPQDLRREFDRLDQIGRAAGFVDDRAVDLSFRDMLASRL